MTPSVAPPSASDAAGAPPAASSRLDVLRKRPEFLATAKGRRTSTDTLNLQARDRADGATDIRYGITATKKVGGAVVRNRAKRRLRALARDVLAELGQAGWDYVLVARPGTTTDAPFEDLRRDLTQALLRIHGHRK